VILKIGRSAPGWGPFSHEARVARGAPSERAGHLLVAERLRASRKRRQWKKQGPQQAERSPGAVSGHGSQIPLSPTKRKTNIRRSKSKPRRHFHDAAETQNRTQHNKKYESG